MLLFNNFKFVAGVCCSALVLSSCANFNTVGRKTSLSKTRGVAVHLDAQQRAIIKSDEYIFDEKGRGKLISKYCAEPSPDALASYASSLGLSGDISDKQALAISAASGSSAAGIGLRTQSITLMRDALYRMCEASFNNKLTSDDMAALLGRSQDLTAVVLAIEQLTGAVVAKQPILLNNASSDAFANITRLQEILDQQREKKIAQESIVKDAEKEFETAKGNCGDISADVCTKPEGGDVGSENAKARLDNYDTFTEKKKEKERAEKRLEEIKDTIKQLEEAAKIELKTSSSTTSASSVLAPIVQNGMDSEVSAHVANAVKEMVKEVLGKDYFTEASERICLSFLIESLKKVQEIQTNAEINQKSFSIRKNMREEVGNICKAIIERLEDQ